MSNDRNSSEWKAEGGPERYTCLVKGLKSHAVSARGCRSIIVSRAMDTRESIDVQIPRGREGL